MEEQCAYAVLKKLVYQDAEKPDEIEYFSKVKINNTEQYLVVETYAKTTMIHFKSDNGDSIMKLHLTVERLFGKYNLHYNKNKSRGPDGDSIQITRYNSGAPKYKTGRQVTVNRYKWFLYNKSYRYVRGIVDTDFFIKDEAQYDHVGYVHPQYALIKHNGEFGVLGRNSEVLLPFSKDYLWKHTLGLIKLDSTGYYFIDPLSGKITSSIYSKIDLGALYKMPELLVTAKRNGKNVLIKEDLTELTPFIYDDLRIKGWNNNRFIVGSRGGASYMIDSNTGEEISNAYDAITFKHQIRNQAIVQKSGKYGLIDFEGTEVVEPIQGELLYWIPEMGFNNRVGVMQDGKYALYDLEKAKLITEADYDSFFKLTYLIGVTRGGKHGAIDQDGRVAIPIKYEALTERPTDNSYTTFVLTGTNGKHEVKYDQTGNLLKDK